MAAPVVAAAAIGAGASIASAIVQWKISEAGMRATAEERARVEGLLRQVQDPNFDFSTISPQQFEFIDTYVPEVAPFVEAQNPELIKVTDKQGLRGREVESQALEEMLELARSGDDPLAAIERARSGREAAANSQSARATLDSQFARRGAAPGSGLQYAGNLQAQSDAFMGDALAGEAAAADAANRRYGALQDSANLGGDIFQRELGTAEKNANVMNDFNSWLRDARQGWGDRAAATRNNANLRAADEGQRIRDQNVGLTNGWRTQERDRQDTLKQRVFDNSMNRVGVSAGLSNQRVGDINANTVQQNSAVQGAANGVNKTAQWYASENAKQERDDDPLRRR